MTLFQLVSKAALGGGAWPPGKPETQMPKSTAKFLKSEMQSAGPPPLKQPPPSKTSGGRGYASYYQLNFQ